jgi:predicted GNAT family N-acyltransferase
MQLREDQAMNINTPIRAEKTLPKQWRDLDSMDFERAARGLMAFHPSIESIGPLLEAARPEITGLATQETVLRVFAHNPDCLFAIARSEDAVDAQRHPAGFIGQLPLNDAGAEALFSGDLDTANPQTRFLCRQNERPAAIYIWAIFTHLKLAGAIALVMERLSSAKNRAAPLYCKATSEKSHNFFLTLGFRAGVLWNGKFIPELMEYSRSANTRAPPVAPQMKAPNPIYDSVEEAKQQLPEPGEIGVTVVHRLDDLFKVLAVRAATYIVEQDCPYAEEFDGNDFTATHLLGYIGNEPAGCLRIRYFAEFAKLERLAVIARFRRSHLAFQLIKAGISFCAAKGYRKLYGHAEPRLVKLWERFGFKPRTQQATFSFSDLAFVEGDLELPLDPNALTARSDPYVLLRPEGRWDRPGVLDDSAKRTALSATTLSPASRGTENP